MFYEVFTAHLGRAVAQRLPGPQKMQRKSWISCWLQLNSERLCGPQQLTASCWTRGWSLESRWPTSSLFVCFPADRDNGSSTGSWGEKILGWTPHPRDQDGDEDDEESFRQETLMQKSDIQVLKELNRFTNTDFLLEYRTGVEGLPSQGQKTVGWIFFSQKFLHVFTNWMIIPCFYLRSRYW